MKDSQKVYIRGNENRRAEVIKALTDLGGINSESYAGDYEKALYYINPRGKIEYIYDYEFSPECLLVKEFYKEIKLPRWKPECGDSFYYIVSKGSIMSDIWYGRCFQEERYKFGNCFGTQEEAEAARDKIKEMLNNK